MPVLLGFIFLSVMTGTMINVALPFIGEHFEVDEGTFGWISTAYMLTFGVFAAIHGRLADIYGVRRLYLFGGVVFALGALFSAIAPTVEILIFVRLLQGMGAAAIPALGATIIGRLLPPQQRGAAMGSVIATVGIAASISPFIGGAVLEWTSWRVVFLVPGLGVFLLPIAARVLPSSLDETDARDRFDGLGAALLGLGAGALLLATSLVEDHGVGAVSGGTATLGGVLLLAFVARINTVAIPFAPPGLFTDRRYTSVLVTGALGNAGRFGSLVLVPILLEDVVGASPFAIGAALFPGAIAMAVLSPLAGRIADRTSPRAVAIPGSIGLVLACLCTLWLVPGGVVGLAVAMTLYGTAFSFLQTPLLGSLATILSPSRLGVGNGIYLMVFFLGGAFGVAFSITILGSQPVDTLALIGPGDSSTGRYSNAWLGLSLLSALALPALPWLPGAREAPTAKPSETAAPAGSSGR
jgi:EmrB/QacA subfamily drug resistance transporter